MVEKSVIIHEPTVVYSCGVCNFPFQYKKDAERCEVVPVKKYKFEIGDKVELDNNSRSVGMITRRYILSMADSGPYPYTEETYKIPTIFGRTHQNRYTTYVAPEKMMELASSKKVELEERKRILKSLSNFSFGASDEREDDLKKIGRYEDSIIEKLRKADGNVFKLKGQNEWEPQ
jgi:hypothetical protein